MSLDRINKLVVSYCDIPENIAKNHPWLQEASCDSYIITMIEKDEPDELSQWLLENYPELEFEESFFIHMDY